ncbi:hypothetical protein [uncultured Paracoccus sp.]|uniref:hypothetical protein n=1 Tax=uncultured Paracoccus sp. TaxID=189685 RepID=UPI002615B18F|nr:hypothetical protein [uncultured Paracoccus sp.]
MVRGLAKVGVEAMVAEHQREVVGAGLLVLLLSDTAALDQLSARGAAEDTVRGSHQVRARDSFNREFDDDGRVEMKTMPLADSTSAPVNLVQFVVIALLRLRIAMMVTLQLAEARPN